MVLKSRPFYFIKLYNWNYKSMCNIYGEKSVYPIFGDTFYGYIKINYFARLDLVQSLLV